MSKAYSLLLDDLLNGKSLAEKQAYDMMYALAEGELPAALAGALLAGLRAKGETADEIRGFATAMRELAIQPNIPAGAPTVDTVGTGGDGSGSLNLSTGTGLLAAACGSSDVALDSDADNVTLIGRTPVITVLANVIDRTWDAGVAFVEVGGVVITTPETLPFTGANIGEGGMAGIALALLALGGVALLSVRRREDETVVVAEAWTDLG